MKNNIKDLGDNLKGLNFDAWGGIDNFLRETSTGAAGTSKPQLLRRVNSWLSKATDMTAIAVSQLPFDIFRANGEVFDTSSDWQNKLGGITSPRHLFYNLASSLCLGKAYVIPQYTSRMITDLHYCAPHTVMPLITTGGLQQFSRTSDFGESGTYFPAGRDEIPEGYSGEMMYFWLSDSDVEIGPAKTYPASSALLPAELITAMDSTLQITSERGFIPPTIISVKGMIGDGQREKAETWWNSFLRRWTQTTSKIINGDSVDVKQVGAGMDQLKTIYGELKKQAIEDLAASYGIPAAIFMSDMAFATEVEPMIKVWYSTSQFMKLYQCIEDTFNTQLLHRFDLSLKFNPDALDAFQQDEQVRAAAYREYISTDMRPSIAAEMLGLDLPQGIEYPALDEFYDKRLEGSVNDKPVNPITDPAMPKPELTQAPEQKPTTSELQQIKPVKMDVNKIKEIHDWYDTSRRAMKKGNAMPLDWECKYLSPDEADNIRRQLKGAVNDLDVVKAFEIDNGVTIMQDGDALRDLAKSINMAMEGMDQPPQQPNINITMPPIQLTAQMPAQGSVVVNVPEQPAPVVNVTNSPAVNNIKMDAPVNNVTVQPAKVELPPMPTKASITTDKNGKKTLTVQD